MEWFWAVTGGLVVVLLVFGVLYDRSARGRGREQLQPREPSRDPRAADEFGGSGCASCSG